MDNNAVKHPTAVALFIIAAVGTVTILVKKDDRWRHAHMLFLAVVLPAVNMPSMSANSIYGAQTKGSWDTISLSTIVLYVYGCKTCGFQ